MKNNPKQIENKTNSQKSSVQQSEHTSTTKKLVLQPVGYPFNFNLMETDLEITDKTLFEEYAREQWLGLFVKENSYLFDQKIIPDYGFKVISAEPDKSIIAENTEIKLVEENINNLKEITSVKSDLKLSDIVGQEKAKNKTKVLMKYIENPEKFGEWSPKNILFYGVPGTGKTMLVKALANTLEVPLYLIKATSLIGDHVGDGASKIHDLFEKARKETPSIIFIDEIDAIALHRNFQSLRGDVTEIVNALLTEMDGISKNESIVTIGATNNIMTLDNAVRSRFEEEIEFTLPSDEERKLIIEKNLKTYPLKTDLNIEKLVNLTKHMSGRDIKEKILKASLHNAISHDKEVVDMSDIDYALKSLKINNIITGMHE